MAANSTADAVLTVSASEEPWGAIGTLRAADLYGCRVIVPDIADTEGNSTRFVLLGAEAAPAVGPGRFRTSIICALERDRPGALLAILQEFAMRAVNLSKLESRPTKTGLGRYIFFIDIEGSRERDLPVDAAITAIEEQGVARVSFLGSYPAERRVWLESPRAGGSGAGASGPPPTRSSEEPDGPAGPGAQRDLRAHQRVLAAARGRARAQEQGRGAGARRQASCAARRWTTPTRS